MNYLKQIARYAPLSEQEAADKEGILAFAAQNPDTILTRSNPVAHMASSGFVLNPAMDKALMVHHNIYNIWAWTGGHADGDPDLLAVALREAGEETGAAGIRPLTEDILSIDILPVWGHVKRGAYVSTHLHLCVSYVLIADEDAALRTRPEENSGVRWIPVEEIPRFSDEPRIIAVYNKLIERARCLS